MGKGEEGKKLIRKKGRRWEGKRKGYFVPNVGA